MFNQIFIFYSQINLLDKKLLSLACFFYGVALKPVVPHRVYHVVKYVLGCRAQVMSSNCSTSNLWALFGQLLFLLLLGQLDCFCS